MSEALVKRIEQLEEALRYIRDGWDHDEDCHRYSTACFICVADEALKPVVLYDTNPFTGHPECVKQ
jgi:hypothetical protein